MFRRILVTGGAGFIGSHLVDQLIERNYQVRILDNLTEQVHPGRKIPQYLNPKAEFIRGDVTKRADVRKALENVDAVFHLAAAVGVGQSMYEVAHYTKVNCYGTGLLLDEIVNNYASKIKKIVVAASMSSYGEGLYRCGQCGIIQPPLRDDKSMQKGDYSVKCPSCKQVVEPIPTSEEARQNCNSVYAISKKNQEEMVLVVGRAYGIPAVALRYFNVYGPRQSLSNPYTGVVAIFMSRIKNSKPPIINEDGLQTRDFVHVSDVARANILALEKNGADYQSINVGTGKAITIRKVAETLIDLYKSKVKPEISGRVRKLDVRHCYADTSKIKRTLGWQAKVSFRQGMKELIKWARTEKAVDKVDEAMAELARRGLR